MTGARPTGYAARILWPPDARMTYPLASLTRPGLTLQNWRKTMRRKAAPDHSRLLIGISNAAGCVVAVLHWNGFNFDMLASAPALMMDEALVRLAAEGVLRNEAGATSGAPLGGAVRDGFDPDQG
jgi:hypothetical protein